MFVVKNMHEKSEIKMTISLPFFVGEEKRVCNEDKGGRDGDILQYGYWAYTAVSHG
jgi:hypothetical protein